MPRVKFYASLRKVTGTKEMDMEARTVRELLKKLSCEYGDGINRYLKISTVLVNGKNVIHMRGKRTRLRPGDEVSIFPPLGGG